MKNHQIPRRSSDRRQRMDTGLRRLITTVILFFCIIVVSVLIVVVYPLSREAWETHGQPSAPTDTDTEADTGVVIREITVEGNRHLTAEAITQASGLRVGQNFMTVSRTAAEANILKNCPYIKSVRITTPAYDSYHITVEEKTAIGAMYANSRWVILGEDFTSLGYMEITSDRPDRYLYIKGAVPTDGKLGTAAMTEQSAELLRILLSELELQQITGIGMIDISEPGDILLEWNHQLQIKLGSEVRLSHKLDVFSSTLPLVLNNHGQQVTGTMDLSSYSDNDGVNQMIFTPGDIVRVTAAPTKPTTTGSTTGTTVPAE